MIDYEYIEKKLDEFLESETDESLIQWLNANQALTKAYDQRFLWNQVHNVIKNSVSSKKVEQLVYSTVLSSISLNELNHTYFTLPFWSSKNIMFHSVIKPYFINPKESEYDKTVVPYRMAV